jgi:hypothetical protein
VRAASVTLTTSAAMPMRLAKTSTLTVSTFVPHGQCSHGSSGRAKRGFSFLFCSSRHGVPLRSVYAQGITDAIGINRTAQKQKTP